MIKTVIDLNDPEFRARLASMRHRVDAPATTQAYVNYSRWIADCSYPGCANAQMVEPGQFMFACVECHHECTVVWPPDAELIDAVLGARPVPSTRHWAPAGHWQAIACGFPDGQTVEDLLEEGEAHL